jgi:hypothetical protein
VDPQAPVGDGAGNDEQVVVAADARPGSQAGRAAVQLRVGRLQHHEFAAQGIGGEIALHLGRSGQGARDQRGSQGDTANHGVDPGAVK